MRRIRRKQWTAAVALGAMLAGQVAAPLAFAQDGDAKFRNNIRIEPDESAPASESVSSRTVTLLPTEKSGKTTTPIKHVILIIGENRTFDHVFATYQPRTGQTVLNLLSEGIVTTDGSPGPNFGLAKQWQASDTTTFSNSPAKTSAYTSLPPINTDGAPTNAHFATVAAAEAVEPALEPAAYDDLTIGGTGLPGDIIDTRFPSVLPNGPVPMD